MTDTATTPPATRPAKNRWRSKAPAAPGLRAILQSTFVGVASLVALVAVGKAFHFVLLAPPLAATAVIIAGVPTSSPAQPRSVLGGHLSSAIVGLSAVAALGASPWTMAIAGGLSLTVMAVARAVHAPAAATAAIIAAQHPPVLRTLDLLMAGSALLIAIGCAAGLLFRDSHYPEYWW